MQRRGTSLGGFYDRQATEVAWTLSILTLTNLAPQMELRGEIEEHGRIVAIVNDEEGLQGFRDVWKADIYLDVDQGWLTWFS